MKQSHKFFKVVLLLPVFWVLAGCGGYARTPNSSSGIDAYGVIDVGVQHESR
jgi:hypothetical protein